MKRLTIWIVVLTVLFGCGIALTKESSRIAPQSTLAEWFTYPDGKPCPMPCLFGIRLGVTTLDEAEIILQQHPKIKITQRFGESSDPFERAFFLNGDYASKDHLEIVLETDTTTGGAEVEEIRLYPNGEQWKRITFYDLLLSVGYPEGVYLGAFESSSVGGSQYEYFNGTIRLHVNEVRMLKDMCQIDLDDQVDLITLFSPKYKRNNFIGIEEFHPWAGLTKGTYWERYYKYEKDSIFRYQNCDQWRP